MSNLNKFNITEATMLALAAQKGVKYRFGDEGMRCMLEYSQALLALATPPVASGALPELPEIQMDHVAVLAQNYTADQMRAYGQACHAVGRGAVVREYIDNGTFKDIAAPNAALVAALEACADCLWMMDMESSDSYQGAVAALSAAGQEVGE